MPSFIEQRIEFLEKQFAVQPQSPLFIQLAELYLQAGRSKDALRICDQGIAIYPFYSTAHIIKGKTLSALHMTSEARREFEFALELVPDSEGVKKLLEDLGPPEEESLAPPAEESPASPEVQMEDQPAAEVSYGEVAPAEAETEGTPGQESYTEPHTEDQSAEIEETPVASDGESQDQGEIAAGDVFGIQNPEEATTAPDAFGEPSPAEETPVIGEEQVQEPAAPSEDDPFGLAATDAHAQSDQPSPETDVEPEQSVQPPEEFTGTISFEQFAEQMKGEMGGTENTISLTDYIQAAEEQPAEPPPEIPVEPPTETNEIEELAEKLQNPPKITPVIDLSDKTTHAEGEPEIPGGGGFVTPTLAEIYAKQGWYDDAINAYKTLAASKPEDRERFEKRIVELEEMKKSQSG